MYKNVDIVTDTYEAQINYFEILLLVAIIMAFYILGKYIYIILLSSLSSLYRTSFDLVGETRKVETSISDLFSGMYYHIQA